MKSIGCYICPFGRKLVSPTRFVTGNIDDGEYSMEMSHWHFHLNIKFGSIVLHEVFEHSQQLIGCDFDLVNKHFHNVLYWLRERDFSRESHRFPILKRHIAPALLYWIEMVGQMKDFEMVISFDPSADGQIIGLSKIQ